MSIRNLSSSYSKWRVGNKTQTVWQENSFYVTGAVKTTQTLHTHTDEYTNITYIYAYTHVYVYMHVIYIYTLMYNTHEDMSSPMWHCCLHFDDLKISHPYDNESADINLVSKCY